MASSNIRALEIAPEPTYCNLSDGIPSTEGLDFQAVEFIDASQITPISDTFEDTEGGRSGYYANAPEPLVTGGNKPVKRGTLSIDFYLRPAASFDPISDGGLNLLFGTRFLLSAGGGELAVITAVSDNTLTFESNFAEVGQVLRITPTEGGPSFYCHVVSFNSSTHVYTVIPSLEGLVSAGDTAFTMYDLRLPSKGGDPVRSGGHEPLNESSQPTVCLRLTGDGWRQVCYGCALTALTMTGTGTDSRAVKCSATIDVAYAEDVSPVENYPLPEKIGGRILHSLAAPLVMSAKYTTAAPTASYASNPGQCVDSWTLTLNWICEGSTCGNTYIGRAPLEATNLEASFDLVLGGTQALSDLTTQWQGGEKRAISLGFDATYDYNASGGCVLIPAAVISDGTVSTVDLGAGFVRTHVILAPGLMTLDASGDNPMIQIGLGGVN